MSEASSPSLQQPDAALPLATLLLLARRAIGATSLAELQFIAVNETHQLTPYRQAVLWRAGQGVVALSGVTSVEANAPYVQWLTTLLPRLHKSHAHSAARIVDASDLSDQEAATWAEWLPAHAAWFSFPANEIDDSWGGLLLVRDEPWTEEEMRLLGEWVMHLAQAIRARSRRRTWMPNRTSRAFMSIPGMAFSRYTWILVGIAASLLIPVRLTVLAPGDLVPAHPYVVRAPMDGVVNQVMVLPNQHVTKGMPLIEFDRASIQSRLQVARQSLATTRAEYRQKAQQALFDADSRSKLAMLQGQIDERLTEVGYLQQLERRGVVTAPREGITLFADPTEWTGRPVVTGERIMVIADQHDVEIEAWLSPADAIQLDKDAPVRLFLNASPARPLNATLRYISYQAEERPDGSYAYRLRARLDATDNPPRIGLKGTAKLEGRQVSLAYWVLRRPLAALRAWAGV